ncbi:MAG: PhoH family protein [Planctomycetaceae bacterium]|nr:PhoH family protein [Planctomycetaceae bacterium]
MTETACRVGSKLFVLDTNVILHDAGCLRNFEENDVAVPITVLEELDRFKKGNEDINFQARSFLRRVDELTGDVLSPAGTSLGPGLGSIRVVLECDHNQRLKDAFLADCPDHRILDVALTLQKHEAPRPVVLVTKDTNLRMKAKAFGLTAQDYSTDKVESIDKLYTGKRLVEGLSSEMVNQFFVNGGHVPADHLDCVSQPRANENFVLRNGSKSVLATFNPIEKAFVRIDKVSASGIVPRNAEQSFALRALLNDDLKLVTLTGIAGSGKTLLALAAAMECRSRYRQILLARPTVPLSNRDLGFLPGDIAAKLDPYMQPLYDNMAVMRHPLGDLAGAPKVQDLLAANHLEVTPLAYIRGRSLQRVFFIVDEAQNLTPHEIKTIITRAGEGTKIVFTGDIQQIDHPYLDSLSNGLSYLIDRMVGQSLFAHITLEKGERSELAELASNLL